MASKKKKGVLSTVVTLLVVLAFLWTRYQEIDAGQAGGFTQTKQDELVSTAASRNDGEALTEVKLLSSHYQVWKNCVVISHRGNDGDSFHVEAPHGREEIRLYYVDAPESAARTYRDGNTNHLRIAQQGAAMGGLDQRETIKVGVDAKAFVKQLLDGKRFKVVTRSERVYGSHRKYAFVIVDWKGQRHYLHELLVLNGLARIHTKPAHLPDNTTASDQKKRLYELQSYAKDMRYGAWGL
ncbi:MAG: thermonuclease family protein [Akkermansiaceae bacterium]|nr:thermonuclease family protein [Akkermansiaceae bacterium]